MHGTERMKNIIIILDVLRTMPGEMDVQPAENEWTAPMKFYLVLSALSVIARYLSLSNEVIHSSLLLQLLDTLISVKR